MAKGWKRSWVKLWVSECLDGSIREDLEADERGIWYDLIIYSARCRHPGTISSNETQPISRRRLAGVLNISEKLLNRAIAKCVASGRLKIDEKGLIHIVNWAKYQSESDRVRAYQKKPDIRKAPYETEEEFKERLKLFGAPGEPPGAHEEFQERSNELVQQVTSYRSNRE